jgi:hypothetical protein
MVEDNITLNNIEYTIEHLKVPEYWMYEGVEPPNALAKTNARYCCNCLYTKLRLVCLATTVEAGVYIVFRKGKSELIIETYNDGDIGALVCREKEILHNEDIKDYNFKECLNVIEKAEQTT